MSTDALDALRQRMAAGDIASVQRQVASLLRADPQNVPAWELLATLLDDPAKQADCYQQILRIDPHHSRAAAKLAALTSQPSEPPVNESASPAEAPPLQCPQCGGAMGIRFVGELRDKQAHCPFCGHQTDLPDTYKRVEKQHEHETRPWGSRTTETTQVETRSNHISGGETTQSPAEVRNLLQELREKGIDGLDDGAIQKLEELGFTVTTSTTTGRRTLHLSEEERLSELLSRARVDTQLDSVFLAEEDLPVYLADITPASGTPTPEDIVQMAGGALPAEKRENCPACAAIVSRDATSCPWCGASLRDT